MGFGLMYYNARWYDPYLNHMTQPDSIVPDPYNSQDYDRYSYVRNNPLKYTDPTGHTVTCDLEATKGCDGFGPARIINSGFDDEVTFRYLRNFLRARSDYQVEYDPLVSGQAGEFMVRTAQFQVEAEKIPTLESQLETELEKPQYEPLLANKYTPVVSGAVSVIATDIQYVAAGTIPPVHPAYPVVIGTSYLTARFFGIVSYVSTGYQYRHNLYETTANDVRISATTTLVSAWPKPDMGFMTHAGFLYTYLRTFQGLESP